MHHVSGSLNKILKQINVYELLTYLQQAHFLVKDFHGNFHSSAAKLINNIQVLMRLCIGFMVNTIRFWLKMFANTSGMFLHFYTVSIAT